MAEPFTLPNQAATGFQNGSHYDQYRPSYPAEAIDKLLKHLGVAEQKNRQIVDLASGTGKLTELLAARPEQFEVVAVEPHEGMRQTLVKKNLPGVKVLDGNAGNMPVEDGWGDALIAGQAFHWFASEESLKEIHRVLSLGAVFGMIWNIDTYNGPKSWPTTTKWEQTLKDIIVSIEDGHPRFRHMQWKQAFEKQQDTTRHFPQFSRPLSEESVKWTEWLSDDGVWARFTTLSQIANLDDGKKEEVRKQIFAALKGDDVERNEKGEAALHVVTYMAWTSRV